LTRFPDANLKPLRSKTHADMTDLSLTILPEAAGDAQAIERLHERTFGPGRFVLSAYRIREHVDHLLDVSFTARIGTLLVGDEPYYSRVGFKPVPKGRVTMPGPVDSARVLVFELVDGAFEGVSGPVGPDWSKARG
jgi:predicted N-acetyltransferase YhbS